MIIRLINANLGKADNIESSAETWGELQTEASVQEFIEGDVQAVIRENQNTLATDEAVLPNEKLTDQSKEYDFTLFFITKKSKAGILGNREEREEGCESQSQLDRIEDKVDSILEAINGHTSSSEPAISDDELEDYERIQSQL